MNLFSRINLKVLRHLNYKLYTKHYFKAVHGYDLNLKSPKSFNEKIQWMKFYGNLESCGKYVDKNDVRSFVKDKVGEKYLIPQIGCYNNSSEVNFERLPNKFVVKATHASGWNLVVDDKKKLNIEDAKKQIDVWVNKSFYKKNGEKNYKHVRGRVVIEEFIEDGSGDLMDYRFFCYDGNPLYIQLDSYSDTKVKKRRNIYDINWIKMDVKCSYENTLKDIERPNKLDEMIHIASKLSEGFNFVRVDLYYVNDNIYFGELTFTPQNGTGKFTPVEYDYLFGQNFELKRY
ncbi:ATP-grasp fold amidoligase family protein [Ammoniphilus resinae]|nr:ATP-grasp fold amidoligase family protein [Ammoniphilus resinae]